MQVFESGGALRLRPMHWRAGLRMLGLAAAALVAPPLAGFYLLVVA